MTRTSTRGRRGFTLVELMVSAAVCVIIMAILARCFQIGIDTMRHMKSTGDLAEQLRAATNVMRRDLQAQHFLPEANKPHNGVRVSDQLMNHNVPGDPIGWTAPLGGFFKVRSTTGTDEGNDTIIASSRADATNGHLLHFTSVVRGTADQELFYATVGPGQTRYASLAAEIAYFLDPTPRGSTGGLPLYHLIRRQRLIGLSDNDAARLPSSSRTSANPDDMTDDAAVVALKPHPTLAGKMVACSMTDLAALSQNRRLASGTNGDAVVAGNVADLAPLPNTSARYGDDILLSNVISFEVKLTWTPGGTDPAPRAFASPAVTDAPFDTLQEAYAAVSRTETIFDTGAPATATTPLKIRVRAIQIRLRVWDPKLQNTRQVTLVQDL